MDEVDIDAFELRCEMGPLVDYFLLSVPVVLVRPRPIKRCRPFGRETIIAPGSGDDVFGRYPRISDFPVIPLDFSLGDVDFERFYFFRHDSVNARGKCAELGRRATS